MHDDVTVSPINAQSGSVISLPFGVQAFANGLEMPSGLTFEQWKLLGTQLVTLAHAQLFMLGDWLAYGEIAYKDSVWSKRLPAGLLENLEQSTGIAASTLKNAKYVCSKVDRARRLAGLTMWKLQEIVARAPIGQVDFWQSEAIKNGWTVATLREKLRGAKGQHRDDPLRPLENPLVEVERFADFYVHRAKAWAPSFKMEVAAALRPVIDDLAPLVAKPAQTPKTERASAPAKAGGK